MMKELNGYWVDSNNNSWYTRYYTEEQAISHSKSLVTCKDCEGCEDCINCISCTNCRDCEDCRDCIYCTICTGCTGCVGCVGLEKEMFYETF